jgi:hypothetical protein
VYAIDIVLQSNKHTKPLVERRKIDERKITTTLATVKNKLMRNAPEHLRKQDISITTIDMVYLFQVDFLRFVQ